MTSFSALSLLLLDHPDQPGIVLESLRSGELDPRRALAQSPGLLAEAIGRMVASEDLEPVQLELVQRLVQHGFNPWQKNERGLDAFDNALILKHPSLIIWLAQQHSAPCGLDRRLIESVDCSISPLFHSDFETTQAMLGVGFSPKVLDEEGNSLLHGAPEPRLVRLLIDAGVDPSIINNKGLTAQDTWDLVPMSKDKRQELDTALSETYSSPEEEVVRKFARNMIQVGVAHTKDRLQKARINPRQAQYARFSLPELLIAHILNDGMQYGSSFGDAAEQKKLRRLVLSSLKMKDFSPAAHDDDAQRLRALVLAFTLISAAISWNNPKEVEIWPQFHGQLIKQDMTVDDLMAIVKDGKEKEPQQMMRAMEAIESLREVGLVSNPSWIYSWLMMGSKSYITNIDGWMESCPNGIPLFYTLGQLAMRGLWDETWQGCGEQLQHQATSSGRQFEVPACFYSKSAQIPGGVGVILCMQEPTGYKSKEGMDLLLDILNDEGDAGTISLKDPLVRVGLEKWRHIATDPEIYPLLDQIERLAKHNDLHADTLTVSKVSVRRM